MGAGAGMSPGGGGMSQSGGMGGLGGGMGGGMGGLGGGGTNPNPFSQQFQAPQNPMQSQQMQPMTGGQMQAPMSQSQASQMFGQQMQAPMQQSFDFGAPQAQPMQQAPLQQGATTPFSASQSEGMRGMPQSSSLGAAFQNAQAAQAARQPQQLPAGLSGLMQQYRQYRY